MSHRDQLYLGMTAAGAKGVQAAFDCHRGSCDTRPQSNLPSLRLDLRTVMADTMDVDPPAASAPKGKTKEDGKGDKKRFEVKKVRILSAVCDTYHSSLYLRGAFMYWLGTTVERCLALGVG